MKYHGYWCTSPKDLLSLFYLLVFLTLVNGLNDPIKRHRVAEWKKKHDPEIYFLWKIHLRKKDLLRLKVKGWKKISKANAQGKKAEVAILVSDKIDFKTKAIKRDTELHFIILKGRIHQEAITIVNIHAPNIGAPKYISKILDDFKTM